MEKCPSVWTETAESATVDQDESVAGSLHLVNYFGGNKEEVSVLGKPKESLDISFGQTKWQKKMIWRIS